MYPIKRLRRLRKNDAIRSMVRETRLSTDNLIFPLFVCHGKNVKTEIHSMPGQYRFSVDTLVEECREVYKLGIKGVMLFGIPNEKDEFGSESLTHEGIVQQAMKAIKKEVPELFLIADICMCEYTSHGHCGIIHNDDVLNDETLKYLSRQALSMVESGADMVAPSDMMDGRIAAIRAALDEKGYENTPIMAYSAKYCSAFYGPFRDAADSAPAFGDRRSYQMDPANSNEAMREMEADIEEGADIIMVKPALPYLDIVRRAHDSFEFPLAAYNVSGEYAMIKAAAQNGWIDEERIVMETMISIRRAGAQIIITYFAKDVARRLNK